MACQKRRLAVRGKVICYDPVKQVGQLFCREDWGAKDFSAFHRELPGKFVQALFDLTSNQSTKIEFQCRGLSVPLTWLRSARILAYSLREIVAATYPTLRCRLMNYEFEEGYFQKDSVFQNHDEQDFSRKDFVPPGARRYSAQNSKTTLYLTRDRDIFSWSSISKMDVLWLHQEWLQPNDQNPGEVDCWITKDSFLFRANSIWVMQRADDRNFLEDISPERALAFAMGCHTRLGEGSQIKHIDPELLRCIENFVINGLFFNHHLAHHPTRGDPREIGALAA